MASVRRKMPKCDDGPHATQDAAIANLACYYYFYVYCDVKAKCYFLRKPWRGNGGLLLLWISILMQSDLQKAKKGQMQCIQKERTTMSDLDPPPLPYRLTSFGLVVISPFLNYYNKETTLEKKYIQCYGIGFLFRKKDPFNGSKVKGLWFVYKKAGLGGYCMLLPRGPA